MFDNDIQNFILALEPVYNNATKQIPSHSNFYQPPIPMYYSLIPHSVSFNKKVPQFKGQKQPARLTRILPLTNNHAILFYDNFWFYHISIGNINVIYQSVLEGKVYDAVVLTDQRILLMIIEKKNIVELNLTTKKVTEIYKITSDSLYNSKRQNAQFFLSKLHTFPQSQTFYLQQNLTDQRKVKVIYFPKHQTPNKIPFQTKQFEVKNYLYLKLDQTSSIVKFAQNPLDNGKFAFDQINLQTNDVIQHKLDWPSFVLYSTVIDIKKFHSEKYLICLNGKNASHQAIVYNSGQKTIQHFFQTQKIFKKCIFINEKLNLCIFSFMYGKMNDSQIITVVDLNSGKTIYKVEEKIDKLAVGKDMDCLIEYSAESRGKQQTSFRVLSLVNKTAHYFKIMEKLKVDMQYGEDFAGIVADMLKK